MFKKALLIGAVALAPALSLHAQEAEAAAPAPALDPAVQALVDNLSTIVESSWKSDFAIQAKEGENVVMDMSLSVQFKDLKHFAFDLSFTTKDEFEGEIKMAMSVVADGSYIYVNSEDMAAMTQGMMSGPVKVELGVLEGMLGAEAGVDVEDGSALKQMMVEGLKELGLKEEGSTEGKRRYVFSGDDGSGELIFNAKTWFLETGEMKSEEGVMTITGSNSGKVKEWPEGTFTFKAAEGVVVTDLTPMLQMGMGPPPGADEEDLEF